MIDPRRIRSHNTHEYKNGPVIYWMDRDMRASDNWALLHAAELAKKHNAPLAVVYNLVTDFLGGGARQLDFKLRALELLEEMFQKKHISFTVLVTDDSTKDLQDFFKKTKAGCIVTDFSPLKIQRKWKAELAKTLTVPFREVDTHNIVPAWEASNKKEFGAYTIRPKIHRQLSDFLVEFPKLTKTESISPPTKNNWTEWKKLIGTHPTPLTLPAGETAAKKALQHFFKNRLRGYAEKRNDPTLDGQSNLSPYLHYGHISTQRIALELKKEHSPLEDKEAFFEELVVRKELADNFCYYEPNYDSTKGFPTWAKQTLLDHANDERAFLYTKKEFEQAKTHDQLWNAAQMEMVLTGKMHGYMRMYWAKKILEWTKSPDEAMKIAIYLNDTYELDGRDPNGYTGISWSIGGTHDRAWGTRPIFGKIRYMNDKGAKRKFDVEAYVNKWMGTGGLGI